MKPNVTESSIDRVLARLLTSSTSVAQAFLEAAAPTKGDLTFDRVTVSAQVPHLGTHGTADLALRLWSENRLQALILIENKIDAGFTPTNRHDMRSAETRI